MNRIAILSGLALSSLLFVSCSGETAEAKVDNLKAEIAELTTSLKDASADDKAGIEKKIEGLKKDLDAAMKAVAEEMGDKAKEAVDGAGDAVKDLMGDK